MSFNFARATLSLIAIAENSNVGVANDGVDDTEALNDGNRQDAAPAN